MSKRKPRPCELNRIWRIWKNMRMRGGVISVNSHRRDRHYKYYRHVFVCDIWARHFKAFEWWAKRNGYRDDLTLDRIDWRGGYCPSNCRWVTYLEQTKNRHYTKAFWVALKKTQEKARRARWAKWRASHV